jgi:hypothetical protein
MDFFVFPATIVYARWAMITKFSSHHNNKVITEALDPNTGSEGGVPWSGVALEGGVAMQGGVSGGVTFSNHGTGNGIICTPAVDISGQVCLACIVYCAMP